MKIFLIICALFSICASTPAQDHGILVSGKAVTEIQADTMQWSLQVTTAGVNLEYVAVEQLQQMTAVVDMLVAAGIQKTDLESDEYVLWRTV